MDNLKVRKAKGKQGARILLCKLVFRLGGHAVFVPHFDKLAEDERSIPFQHRTRLTRAFCDSASLVVSIGAVA